MTELWAVNVQGPDDMIPAPDEATARRWALEINTTAAQAFARDPSPNDPAIHAEVAPWPHDAASHAQGPGEEYGWLLSLDRSVRVHETNGHYVVADGCWLPGCYATVKAARDAAKLSDTRIAELWKRKGFQENGKPDGTTDYCLTEADVDEALAAQGRDDA